MQRNKQKISVMENQQENQHLKYLPHELKDLTNWVFITEKENNPCNNQGFSISYTEKKNRKTFHDLEKIQKNQKTNFGYGFYLNSEYVCIDIDKCFEGKKTNMYPWAKDYLSGLQTKIFYTEYSRSGYGLHVFAKMSNELRESILKNSGKKNISFKIRNMHDKYFDMPAKSGIEFFSNRVITITGDCLLNSQGEPSKYDSLVEADYKFKEIYDLIVKLKKQKVDKANKTIDSELKYEADIFNIIKTKVTLEQLFNYYMIDYDPNNNISCPLDNLNHSNGDQKPSFSITESSELWHCFTCDKGGSVIDFVMEKEGLTALESAKFINKNLDLGLKFHKKFEAQEIIKKNCDRYVQQVISQGANIPEDMLSLPWIVEEESKQGDINTTINTGILSDFLRKNIDYIFARSASTDATHRFFYNHGYYNRVNDDEFRGYIKKYMPLELRKPHHINDTLQELYTDHRFKKYNDLNPENIINFKNGLYVIESRDIVEHTPDILSTIQIPTKYNVNMIINNNVFDNYLDYLVKGNEQLKRLVMQFTGVTLSNVPGYLMKQALFMVGVHNTGKSKIKELLGMLLGEENTNYTTLKELETTFGGGGIYNKRLIGSNDEPFITLKGLNFLKQIVSGDTVRVQDKFIKSFNLKFPGIIWICCNELPKFGGDKNDGVYDRLVIIKTNDESIPPEKRDKKLLDKMYSEKNHIIQLALKGLHQVIDNGYNYDIPQVCKDELEEYKTDNDHFLSFIKECTEPINNASNQELIPRSKFFNVYKQYCLVNNIKFTDKKSDVKLKLNKKSLGDVKKNSDGIMCYTRFTLNEEAKQDFRDILLFP